MTSRRVGRVGLAAAMLITGLGPHPSYAAANLERYVALGDSLTAGFADGGLHIDGQKAGYAQRLAEQANGERTTFEQPWMTDPGLPAIAEARKSPRLSVVPKAGLGSPVNLTLPRPYDNLAVPGAGVGDLIRTRSDGGGLHDLVLRGLGSQLEQALLLEPTFVSLWAGYNDLLRAAVSGIVLDGVTMLPGSEFAAQYNSIVQSLVAGGATEGVVATIPNVTALPFVTAVPTVAVGPKGDPVLVAGARVPLIGPEGPLSSDDNVLLTATPLLARGDGVLLSLGGSGRPLPDNVVLDSKEARQIRARTAEYNDVIRRAAADVGFAVVESELVFEEASRTGTLVAGHLRSSDDLFSLDGVHPSPVGHAALADAFIEAINRTYGNTIPAVASVGSGSSSPVGAVGGGVFTERAYSNLRFGLRLPKAKKLLRLKRRALGKALEEERKKRLRERRFELPPPPQLAAAGLVAAL